MFSRGELEVCMLFTLLPCCKTSSLPARPLSLASVLPVISRHGGMRGLPHEEEEARPALLHGGRGA